MKTLKDDLIKLLLEITGPVDEKMLKTLHEMSTVQLSFLLDKYALLPLNDKQHETADLYHLIE